jgi:hypothetical protein
MEISIDKGIPIPDDNRSKFPDFPYDAMECGDSFFYPAKDGQTIVSLQSGLSANAKHWAIKNKSNFLFRTAKEGDGVRIWRVR